MLDAGRITQREPLDLLAEASRILASSIDLSATLPRVAELCVSEICDRCIIEAAHPEAPGARIEAARSGIASAEDDDETVLSVPLRGRQNVFGSLTLRAARPLAFTRITEKLADVLALQIANALEQAALLARTHRIADRLQRALLPSSFPTIEGAVFDGAYKPASEEAEVGGDWYDAFDTPDGRIAISMGDVAGHGLEAATVMGEIRQALRAASVGEQSPAQVLQQINSVINLRAGIGMVTAIFGYYAPPTRQLVYAVAGHPAPILSVEGGFRGFLPGGGIPLGVAETVHAEDFTLTLPPRSCAVFYTDGMTEYGRDVLAGEARLLDASARAHLCDRENPAIALQERIFDAQVNRDDAATLTLSCDDGSLPEEFVFSAVGVNAPIARSIMHRFCDLYGLNEDERFSIIAAVGEAIANSVEHAYRGGAPGLIFIRPSVDDESITIEVEDHGRWRPFQRREERGRGITLMHELMDRVRISSAQDRTLITMHLNRTIVAAAAQH